MSGGVDSSVAAYLLKEQGHEVIGMFMRNWHDTSVTISDECPWVDDSRDAMLVAEQLGIPFQVIDLSEEYKQRIVDYMFAEYEAGRTPNPDVLCNREIKFDSFLKAAMALGADFVATGHYVQKGETEVNGSPVYRLISGADPNKDQSYFLCQLRQEQLARALFPIGHLQKPEVRAIAEKAGLITAAKKDSQGLCFIGKVKLPVFLQQQLKPKDGKVIEIPADHPKLLVLREAWKTGRPEDMTAAVHWEESDGIPAGIHHGAHYFTVGQRKGLQIGGKEKPMFVLGTDTQNNIVYTGQGEDHPGLYRHGLFIAEADVHWIRHDLKLQPGERAKYLCRIRYRQALFAAELHAAAQGLFIIFDQPQKAVAPGQFAAWYMGDELIGSGTIL